MPQPSYRGTTPPRTVEAPNRAEAAAALTEHLRDEELTRGLLDLAEMDGDAQVERAKVCFDGGTWFVDLFGPRREAA